MARRLIALLAALALPLAAHAAACIAQSGERRAALVELYTAARCGGCADAERWLSRLAKRAAPAEIVPLALHVDYADYLARDDAATGRRLARRERRLVLLQRVALVYAPQVLLQGREFRGWDTAGFPEAVTRIVAQPAPARLRVALRSSGPSGLATRVDAEILEPAQRPDAVLYIAAFERSPPNEPPRVLEWQGPLAPASEGRFAEERRLALLPGASPGSSGVAAFVQNRRTGEVLQAVLRPACSP
jgi:hypothetical protein